MRLSRYAIGFWSIVVGAALVTEAIAADYPTRAGQITMRNRNGKGSLRLVMADPIGLGFPVPGSGDDPSVTGMTLTVVSRGTGEMVTFHALPGSEKNSWKVRLTPNVVYNFRDGAAATGDIQTFAWRRLYGLKLTTRDSGLPLNGMQGPIAVRIEFGSARVCALSGNVHREEPGFFSSRGGSAVALANCDDATLLGTP